MITTLIVLFGFTFIIFIHELGHFLAARRVGIQVQVFSIGIGPRLVTLFRDEQGTEYILSLLPLGGYVKMLGQEDMPSQEPKKALSHKSYAAKTPSQRLLVIVAGVAMNLISAYFLIILAYTLGIGFTTNKVGGLEPGTPIATSDITIGEEIISLNNKEVHSFEDILTTTAFIGHETLIEVGVLGLDGSTRKVSTRAYKNNDIPIALLGMRPYATATIATLPTSSSYYLAGLRKGMLVEKVVLTNDADTLSRKTATGMLRLISDHPNKAIEFHIAKRGQTTNSVYRVTIPETTTKDHGFEIAALVQVTPNYPAQISGIQTGDTIIAINKIPIQGFQSLQKVMAKINSTDPISVTVSRAERLLTLSLSPHYDAGHERYLAGVSSLPLPFPADTAAHPPAQRISYISPAMAKQVPGLRQEDLLLDLTKGEQNVWHAEILRDKAQISFTYEDTFFEGQTEGMPLALISGEKIIQYDFATSLIQSFNLFSRELQEVYLFLGNLINGTLPASAVGGPIAIFDTFQTLSSIKGLSYFLLLFAKISISLAIINMLPIPLLDGGHAAFIGYEMIRRKPAPEEFIRIMNLLGFVFLILLMIFVNYNDIMRIISR